MLGGRDAVGRRLRFIASDEDQAAPWREVVGVEGHLGLMLGIVGGLGLLVVILVTLAASGIYAMMSFSVSERTREIGIRTAL